MQLEGHAIQQRLARLEDPISALHPDVPELSELIYVGIKERGREPVNFTDEFKTRYQRALALLESHGLISGTHTFAGRFYAGVWIANPTYMLYMCMVAEDPDTMQVLMQRVDTAPVNQWIHGLPIAQELALPLRVVDAVFELYESRGLGLRSRTIGESLYLPRA